MKGSQMCGCLLCTLVKKSLDGLIILLLSQTNSGGSGGDTTTSEKEVYGKNK